MSYPNISINSVLNYIYAKSEERPFEKAKSTANDLYWFACGHGYIRRYEPYTAFVLSVLNALTGVGTISAECQSAVNHYFAATAVEKYDNAPPECIAAIRAGTEKLTAEYNAALEKTAETRRLLSHSCPIIFDQIENTLVVDYIKYVKEYEPEQDAALFYSSLFSIGFIQGIRAERARRNGTPIPTKERNSAAAYTGHKHKRRYFHSKPTKEQKLFTMFEKMSPAHQAAMLDLITAVESNKFSLDDIGKTQAQEFFNERLEEHRRNGVQFLITS